MEQIAIYPFPENPTNNLNLFPLNVVVGNIVFHGTSSIYCDYIEANGFERGWSPFDENQGNEFVQMLSDLGMQDYIENKNSSRLSIRRYLENRKVSSLSFAFGGYEALFYATNLRLGGQIYLDIQNALSWIDKNELKLNDKQQSLYDIFYLKIKELHESKGCIYLLDFNKENDIFYGDAYNDIAGSFQAAFFNGVLIDPSRIIGKMFIPKDYRLDNDLLKSSVKNTKINSQTRGTYIFDLFSSFMEIKD